MEKISTAFLFFLLIGSSFLAKGQGCSDAGFCTIDSFTPASSDSAQSTFKNALKLGLSTGGADHDITIVSSYLDYKRQLTPEVSLEAKLFFLSQRGNNLKAAGLSDLILTTSYALTPALTVTGGIKVPLQAGNKEYNGLPLPMDYQPSLGTLDLILGAGYTYRKLKLVMAWQQPLTQNKNRFLAEIYPDNSSLRQFQSTNKYVRSGDVLLRVSYPVAFGKKITFLPSILPIYHLQNDRFTDQAGTEKTIAGSKGLTLNGNIYLEYALAPASVFSLIFGAPAITRKARPDGLTRSYVLTAEYKINF